MKCCFAHRDPPPEHRPGNTLLLKLSKITPIPQKCTFSDLVTPSGPPQYLRYPTTRRIVILFAKKANNDQPAAGADFFWVMTPFVPRNVR